MLSIACLNKYGFHHHQEITFDYLLSSILSPMLRSTRFVAITPVTSFSWYKGWDTVVMASTAATPQSYTQSIVLTTLMTLGIIGTVCCLLARSSQLLCIIIFLTTIGVTCQLGAGYLGTWPMRRQYENESTNEKTVLVYLRTSVLWTLDVQRVFSIMTASLLMLHLRTLNMHF